MNTWAQIAGDFRSVSNGGWNTPSTWERFTGAVWEIAGTGANNPGLIPTSQSSVFIQSSTTVIIDAPSVCHHLTIDAGADLQATVFPLQLTGNWSNNGNFLAGSSTVTFNGADQIISGVTTTFHHLQINSSTATTLAANLIVDGNLSSSVGTLKTATFDITVSGLTTVDGTGSIKDAGAGIKQYNGGLNINGGSFVSTVPISIPSTGSLTVSLGNLTINTGTFEVASGALINLTGGNITIGNGQQLIFNETVNMSGGVINGGGDLLVNAPFALNGGAFNGAGSTTISPPYAMTITGTASVISRNLSVLEIDWLSGDITIGTGTIVSVNHLITSAAGTVLGNGTLTISGAGASLAKSGVTSTTINCLLQMVGPSTINITEGILSLGGNGTLDAAITLTNGSTMQFANGIYTIGSGGSVIGTASHFIINGGTVITSVALNLDANSDIVLSLGVLTLLVPQTILPPLTITGGTMSLTAAITFESPVTINGGTLTATAPFVIDNSSALNFMDGDLILNVGSGVSTVMPGATTDISLGTINLTSGQTLNLTGPVVMHSGTIAGSGTLSCNATFLMHGGTLTDAGPTNIVSPGVMTIDSAVDIQRPLNIYSVLNWISGDINMSGGAVITIANGATATFNSNGIIASGGAGGGTVLVTGNGSLLQKNSASPLIIEAVFSVTNAAVFSMSAGNLILSGGGNYTGTSNFSNGVSVEYINGTFNYNTNATVNSSSLNMIINGADLNTNVIFNLTGSSSISILNGTFNAASTMNVLVPVTLTGGVLLVSAPITFNQILTVNGGTMTTTASVNFASSSSLLLQSGNIDIEAGIFTVPSGMQTTIQNGAITVSGGALCQLNGPVTMSGGNLGGVGNYNITGGFILAGGLMSGQGFSNFNPPGTLTAVADFTSSRPINVNTTFNWTAGTITLTGSTPMTIGNGAVATFSSAGAITSGGAGVVSVNGAGTIIHVTGIPSTTINTEFNVATPAILSIESGNLILGGGGILSGPITLPATTALQFNIGNFIINNPATITGSGNLLVSGADVESNIPLALGSTSAISVSGGSLVMAVASTIQPPVTVTGGALELLGATIFTQLLSMSSGSITTAAPITISTTSALNVQGGSVNIDAGTGSFLIPSVSSLTLSGGSITIASGQTLNVAGPTNISAGTINGVGTFIESNALLMSGGSMSSNGITNITSTGSMSVTGTVSISRSVNTPTLNWTAGNIGLTSATLNVTNQLTTSSAGTMSGSGTLTTASLIKSGSSTNSITSQMNVGSGGVSVTGGTLVFGSNDQISGNLSIATNAKVRITNGEIVTVQTLTLGGKGAIAGSWGSSSSSATNKNNTYFETGTTGIVQVATNTCIPPAATISSPTTVLTCTTPSILLTGGGIGFYTWDNASTNSTRTVTTPGVYTLTITSNGCGTSTTNRTITQNIAVPPVTGIVGDFTKTCSLHPAGQLIGETSQPGFSYSWSPANGLSSTFVGNPLANPLSTTIYTVTKTSDVNGCVATANVNVVVNINPPVVNAGSGFLKTCSLNPSGMTIGEPDDISATYLWTPSNGLSSALISNPSANPSTTTNYILTKTDIINGCSSTGNVTVTVNTTPPVISAGTSFTKTCIENISGGTIGEINDVTATYAWTPSTGLSDATVSNPLANPVVTTSYLVTKTNIVNGCTSTSGLTISVNNTPPDVTASSSINPVCDGTSSTLSATGANSYTWLPGALNGANVIVSPNASTTYTVTGTNTVNGCMNTSTISIIILPLPILNTSVSSATICAGSTVTCTASGAETYVWMPGQLNGSSVIVAPANSTTYTVTGTSVAGCTSTAIRSVVVNPLPSTGINATSSTICAGTSTTMTASGASSYLWSPGGSTASTITVSPSTSVTYTVTGTNASGCTSSATKTIIVNNCNVTVNLKLFIEGYYLGGGIMTPVRANEGIGSSAVNVDFITVELHNASNPALTVASTLVFLKTNGTATATFTNVTPGNYYLAIKHRNAIETWSANPINTALPVNYDFTTNASQAYGGNMVQIESGVWAFYSGDITADNNIDLLDLGIIELDILDFASGYLETDINGDGNVDLLDNPILENNISQFVFSMYP